MTKAEALANDGVGGDPWWPETREQFEHRRDREMDREMLARRTADRSPRMSAGGSGGRAARIEDRFVAAKDADPAIPILKEAKAEYAKLQ